MQELIEGINEEAHRLDELLESKPEDLLNQEFSEWVNRIAPDVDPENVPNMRRLYDIIQPLTYKD